MPGGTVFTKPSYPRTKITFVGEAVTRVAPSFAEVVAVPIAHDWGPKGSDSEGLKLVTSFPQFEEEYGTSDTPGRRAVLSAFAGQGLPGQGGAGGVYVYRMATGAAAPASITLQNATPADAITITAKYTGDFGEQIAIGVGDDPGDATLDRLTVYVGGVPQQHWTYAPTDIEDLVEQINASESPYITATLDLSGVALGATPAGNPTELAGGDNGDTLTVTEYAAALSALQFKRVNLLAFPNLTDSTIRAAAVSWVQSQEEANRPVNLVIGGAAGESLATAALRSSGINDEHVINLGVGTYHDDLLDADVSTAELAPRIAGILAARGESRALTGSEIAGLTVVGSTGVDVDEIPQAIAQGVTVLMRTSSEVADLTVAMGVTTYITKTDTAKPYDVFSEPRMVRIMDIFSHNMAQWANDEVIGDLPVNDDSRAAVRGHGRILIDDLLRRGLIDPGETPDEQPFIDTPPPPPNIRDSIVFTFGWAFNPTTNYVIGNGRIRVN